MSKKKRYKLIHPLDFKHSKNHSNKDEASIISLLNIDFRNQIN